MAQLSPGAVPHCIQYAMVGESVVHDTDIMSGDEISALLPRSLRNVSVHRYYRCPMCEEGTTIAGRLREEMDCPAVRKRMQDENGDDGVVAVEPVARPMVSEPNGPFENPKELWRVESRSSIVAHRLRIQRKRTKGFKLPLGTVCVTRPSKWGNPFTVAAALGSGCADTKEEAAKICMIAFQNWLIYDPRVAWRLADFRLHNEEWARKRDWILDHLNELEGRNVACYCSLLTPCHGDVLAELANPRSY